MLVFFKGVFALYEIQMSQFPFILWTQGYQEWFV